MELGHFNSGDVKGTLPEGVRYHSVPNDVRRHRLISISYISLLSCHGRRLTSPPQPSFWMVVGRPDQLTAGEKPTSKDQFRRGSGCLPDSQLLLQQCGRTADTDRRQNPGCHIDFSLGSCQTRRRSHASLKHQVRDGISTQSLLAHVCPARCGVVVACPEPGTL